MINVSTVIWLLPVAVIQYTFTQKQYTRQYIETEYPEQNLNEVKI